MLALALLKGREVSAEVGGLVQQGEGATVRGGSLAFTHTWRLARSKALRAVNVRLMVSVYPAFEVKKSNESDEKLVTR